MKKIGVKAFTPAQFTLNEAGEVLVAFARIDSLDEDGHITLPGAIPTKAVAISDYAHSSWPQKGGRLPVGRGQVEEQGDLGIFRGSFFLDTDQGRNAHATVKGMGDLQEWSYGYEILDSREVPVPGMQGKTALGLASLDIFEISPVLLGAAGRGNTGTLAIKESPDPYSGEEVPLAGISLVDQTGRLLAGIDGWKSRVSDLRDLRVKEGRVLSSQNRDRIRSVADALVQVEEIRKALVDLLEETDPAKKSREMEILRGQWLRTETRIAGLID